MNSNKISFKFRYTRKYQGKKPQVLVSVSGLTHSFEINCLVCSLLLEKINMFSLCSLGEHMYLAMHLMLLAVREITTLFKEIG